MDEVAHLIRVARVLPSIEAAERKAADLRFITLCTNSINIGDVLFQIAWDVRASTAIRLNAALAMEPLISRAGWVEGAHFSDTSAVKMAMMTAVSAADERLVTKVGEILMRSLALIIVLEFPAPSLSEWLRGCCRQLLHSCPAARQFLKALPLLSHQNYKLWFFLAEDVTRDLLHTSIDDSAIRDAVMTFFLNLMSKRPRPSVEQEIASSSTCSLLSPSIQQFVLQQVVCRVEEAKVSGGADVSFSECATVFTVASRLVTDEASAQVVMDHSSYFLVQLRQLYMSNPSDKAILTLTESLLECMLSVLQIHPGVACQAVQMADVFTCLLAFMVDSVDDRGESEDGLATELMDVFLDDEAVPLGCGGGDVVSLAGAVLELFLELHRTQMVEVVGIVNQLMADATSMSPSSLCAVAKGVRSLARVCEESNCVVVDELPPNLQAEFLGQASSLILSARNGRASSLFVDAFSRCFYSSKTQNLASQLVVLLQQVYMMFQTNRTVNSSCVQSVCLHAAGRLLSEAQCQSWSTTLLSEEWLSLALHVASSGDALGSYCAGYLLCTILYTSPQLCHTLPDRFPVLHSCLQRLCINATRRGTAAQLTQLLKCLLALSPSRREAVPQYHHCELTQQSCAVVLAFCVEDSPSRHLVVQSLLEYLILSAKLTLSGDGCATCTSSLVTRITLCLPVKLLVECVYDEASCRCLSSSFTLATAASYTTEPSLVQYTYTMLQSVLQKAVPCNYSSQTISFVAAHLGLVALFQPTLLDESAQQLLPFLFGPSMLPQWDRGVNYTGLAFYASLIFLRSPHLLEQSCSAGGGGSDGAFMRAIAEMAGWWCSMAPFLDRLLAPYFLAATHRVLDALRHQPLEQLRAIAVLPPCSRQYVLPTIYVKKEVPKYLAGGHILHHLSVALCDMKHRYARTTKPRAFDALLESFLTVDERRLALLCGTSTTPFAATGVFTAEEVVHCADSTLDTIANLGFGDAVQHAWHFVTT